MICRNVLLRGQEKKITCLWTPVCDKGVSCYTGRDHKISAVQLSSIPRPFWLSRTCRKDGSIILKQRQCESSCFELFDFISPKMDFYKQMKLALLCLVWMVTLTSGFHIKPNASARRGKKIYMLRKTWPLTDIIIWTSIHYFIIFNKFK